MDFWNRPQRGANSFNATPPGAAYFKALMDTGATWVRLTFTKWRGRERDFLLGNADNYEGIVAEDLIILRRVLDAAHLAGLRVVLTPLSLPGARWIQHNEGAFDDRLWLNPVYARQAVDFWRDLARVMKDHPAIAAYNLLNEPAPEKTTGLVENDAMPKLRAWQSEVQGTTRDLPALYRQKITAIRVIDPVTPVMVDAGYYANPRSLAAWPDQLADDRVLYAIHMYEPYNATSAGNMRRKAPLRYPGVKSRYAGGEQVWNRAAVAAHIDIAFDWVEAQGLPATRLVVAEFGCMRRWPDCAAYLTDVIDSVDKRGGHWAFYAFREDDWEGMDYELPQNFSPGRFYWLTEQGKTDRLPRNGELMSLLRYRMRNQTPGRPSR